MLARKYRLYHIPDADLAAFIGLWEQMTHATDDNGYQFGHTETTTVDEAVTFMAESLRRREGGVLWGVWVDIDTAQDGLSVAIAGNGPNSENNARAIANILEAFPYLASELQMLRAGERVQLPAVLGREPGELPRRICGAITHVGGRGGEPLACAYEPQHADPHSWERVLISPRVYPLPSVVDTVPA